MQKIVIVGAGFGGLSTAIALEKKFRKDKNISITLIDKREYHIFTSNLYEVLSAEEELVSIEQMQKSITLPYKEILAGRNIQFIKDEFVEIDPLQKNIILTSKKIAYDFAVLALGSTSDFYGIEGAEKYGMPLKTLPDVLRIRNQIEFAVQMHRSDVKKKTLRIVVAGGGYTGVETAGELIKTLDVIAWKNDYPRHKIEVEIVEAGNSLIAGFNDRLSKDAYARLSALGVKIRLLSPISKVENGFLQILTGERVAFDVLIWSVGVKANEIKTITDLGFDKKGRVEINELLQAKKFTNIFVIGDGSCILDSNGRPVPATAQDAIHEGSFLAKIFPYILKNQNPPSYMSLKHGFIVCIGGKWAILSIGEYYFTGFFAYVISRLAHLHYYIPLVGILHGIKYVFFEVKYFSRND
jgi:NADH:ubiquinone reductase (H+-translocating)